jgi:hypothetical protein
MYVGLDFIDEVQPHVGNLLNIDLDLAGEVHFTDSWRSAAWAMYTGLVNEVLSYTAGGHAYALAVVRSCLGDCGYTVLSSLPPSCPKHAVLLRKRGDVKHI